jgi:ribosomal-protein-alanine N-acetyltransferase
MELPLVGDRLLLRPFATGDLAAMHAIYSDPEVMCWVGTGPVTTPAESAAMLASYAEHQRVHGFSCWAVVERVAGAVVGDAGLITREEGVEIGYTLAADRWGRGYGTKAAGLCVDAAFG